MNAEIKFLKDRLSLVQIPLHLYPQFLQAIIQVLLPTSPKPTPREEGELDRLILTTKHVFLNVSISPLECSVVCSTSLATTLFEPIIKQLPREVANTVSVSKTSFIVLSVNSAGMDAGSRVVELTSPLALAGIPIFFITTYFSDFILVPEKDRKTVVTALLEKGFECFDANQESYMVAGTYSHVRGPSQPDVEPPRTPPPSTVAELQHRTFKTLKKQSIMPYVEPKLVLTICAGKDVYPAVSSADLYTHHRPEFSRHKTGSGRSSPMWLEGIDARLYTAMIAALAHQPKFLSITLTEDDPPSLLMDKVLLGLFRDSVVGDWEADLVPIFLDLGNLPLEATGIVSGVAGELSQRLAEHARLNPDDSGASVGDDTGERTMMGDDEHTGMELSYLSTAKSGAVILSREKSDLAVEILTELMMVKDDAGIEG